MRCWLLAALLGAASLRAQQTPAPPAPLPDSPGALPTVQQSVTVFAPATPPPCSRPAGCTPSTNPNRYQRFLNSTALLPLSPRQKALLALRDLSDPGNLFTITANAGFTIGLNPHTAYGPAWTGFGRDIGYSFAQDATGEFVSTFALDSLFHEDPHYHRSPDRSMSRRLLHALSHTVISQHDDGRRMVNLSTLLTYPISAEISNLYVPGVNGNAPSTAARVVTGLASDPIDNLITEFLPDFARRVHVRVIFVQQILNNVASGRQGP
jgi:hypothetical protein